MIENNLNSCLTFDLNLKELQMIVVAWSTVT